MSLCPRLPDEMNFNRIAMLRYLSISSPCFPCSERRALKRKKVQKKIAAQEAATFSVAAGASPLLSFEQLN